MWVAAVGALGTVHCTAGILRSLGASLSEPIARRSSSRFPRFPPRGVTRAVQRVNHQFWQRTGGARRPEHDGSFFGKNPRGNASTCIPGVQVGVCRATPNEPVRPGLPEMYTLNRLTLAECKSRFASHPPAIASLNFELPSLLVVVSRPPTRIFAETRRVGQCGDTSWHCWPSLLAVFSD